MHDYPIFIFAALLIFGFGLFSRASERSPISSAMVFVAVGMIAGPIGLGFLKEGIDAPLVRVLAEVTLVLVLFVDATTIDLASLIPLGAQYWVGFTLKQFLFGPLLGALVGWAGGKLVDRASRVGWMNPTFQRLTAWSLAVIAYAMAEVFHGNGFIAAFFGGLMLGTHTPIVRERIHEFGEAEGQQLALFVFLIFGLVAVPMVASYWDARAWMYAILSLTVVRMLPVAVSLIGAKLDWQSIGLIGWFGPRGIASVLYLLMAVKDLGFAGHERIFSIIVLTVLLSVFLHGITAVPLSRQYAKRAAVNSN